MFIGIIAGVIGVVIGYVAIGSIVGGFVCGLEEKHSFSGDRAADSVLAGILWPIALVILGAVKLTSIGKRLGRKY